MDRNPGSPIHLHGSNKSPEIIVRGPEDCGEAATLSVAIAIRFDLRG